VFVYELKNGDVKNTEEIVRNLFEGVNSRNRSSSSTERSALETREMQTQQYQQPNTGFGTGSQGSRGQTFR
jgi:hypothetical protein